MRVVIILILLAYYPLNEWIPIHQTPKSSISFRCSVFKHSIYLIFKLFHIIIHLRKKNLARQQNINHEKWIHNIFSNEQPNQPNIAKRTCVVFSDSFCLVTNLLVIFAQKWMKRNELANMRFVSEFWWVFVTRWWSIWSISMWLLH